MLILCQQKVLFIVLRERALVRSANKFFVNQKDLVILHIDSEKVKPEIRYEVASDGDSFPHVFEYENVPVIGKRMVDNFVVNAISLLLFHIHNS